MCAIEDGGICTPDSDWSETVGDPIGASTQLMADSTGPGTGGKKKKKNKKKKN